MFLSKCRSRCLPRLPHHCVGSARTGNVVGQACESVSYNSLFTAMELSAVCCSCATSFVRFPLKGCGNLVRPAFFHILWRAMQCFSCGCHACESVSCDSLSAAQELRALETWSVRPATVPDCKVTDCGSHVKRVNALSLALSAVVLLMIDSFPSVRRCLSRASSHCIEVEHIALVIGQFWRSVSFNSPFTALELRAVEAWLVSPGSDPVLLCSVCIIPFQLPFMMSFIDSLFTAPELSTLKTWVVRSAIDCNVTDDGTHAKHVVTKDVWPPDHDALSLSSLRKVWQPEAHLLNWCVFSPRAVTRVVLKSRAQSSSLLCWASGCSLSVQLPFMLSFYNPLFTASVPSTLKTWSVRSAKEPACKVTDDGPFVKRVVTRGDAKVDNTVQSVIGLGLHSSRSNSEQSDKLWTFQFLRLWRSS